LGDPAQGPDPIPYKLVTITSGFANYHLGWFIVLSVLTRGARFFIIALLMSKFGPRIKSIIDNNFNLVATLAIVALIGGFVAFRFFSEEIADEPSPRHPASGAGRGAGRGRHRGRRPRLRACLRLRAVQALPGPAQSLLHRHPLGSGGGGPAAALGLIGLWLLALLFVVSAGLGAYHAGVEWGFWAGPSDCGGGSGTGAGNVGDFLNQLQNTRVVSCTEAAWRS
jgi:hypothetical protein